MKILMIGDIVGRPGRIILKEKLKEIRESFAIDFVIANAENAAGGSGLTLANYQEISDSGVDCMTLGDHAFRKREIFSALDKEMKILRPGNFPSEAPGREFALFDVPLITSAEKLNCSEEFLSGSSQSEAGQTIEKEKNLLNPPKETVQIAVFCLLGRVFMQPVDCPFHAADRILEQISKDVKIKILDFHAEATSDKQIMGHYLDGRVSAVLGTHTHVATADETIFPNGTAFQCDVGMTGPFESIIGRQIDCVSETVRTFRPNSFEVAKNDVRINATLVDIDPESGKATGIKRLVIFS